MSKEANYINKSLSYLEQVVIALTNKDSHIPYRQSKLTYFLKDCIGGSSATSLVACIWSTHQYESLSTLRFASRMKCIENKPSRSSILAGKHDQNPQLLQTIENLKRELAMRDTVHSMAYRCMPAGGSEQVYYPSLTINQKKLTEQLARDIVINSRGSDTSHGNALHINSLSQMTYLVGILGNMVWEACDRNSERVRFVCDKVLSHSDDGNNDRHGVSEIKGSDDDNSVTLGEERLERVASTAMSDVDYHGYHDNGDDDGIMDTLHPEPMHGNSEMNRGVTPEAVDIKLSFEQYVLTPLGGPLYNNYTETKREHKSITNRYKELSALISSDDVARDDVAVIHNEIKLCKSQINEMKVKKLLALAYSLPHSCPLECLLGIEEKGTRYADGCV